MDFETVAGGIAAGLIALSAYNHYRNKKIIAMADARVKAFEREVARLDSQFDQGAEYRKRLGLSINGLTRQ